MTLQASGAISFNDINLETNSTGTWQLSYDDERFRSLAGGSSVGSQVSISAQLGATFNGFYYYPRQTGSWTITSQSATRANTRIVSSLNGNGGMSWFVDGTLSNSAGPSRFYTPLTTNIANSYQMNIVQTGWSQTGPGSFNWTVYTNNSSINAGQMAASATSTFGWTTMNGSTGIYFSQSLVSPGGAFDATATGTIQIRLTATPANVISIPFTFRIFAL